MARRKKDIVWPHLNNAGGDLSKGWYVEYSIRNPISGKMERYRHYDGFKELKTYPERNLYAEGLIKKYTEKIKSGGAKTQDIIEYEDSLSYGGINPFFKKKTAYNGSIKPLISEFIEYKKTEISERTLQTYRSKFRYFVAFLENRSLDEKSILTITNQVVVEFLKEIVKERDLSKRSVEKYQQILFTFFEYLRKNKKIIAENPVLNIPRMGITKDESPAAIPRNIRILLQSKIEPQDPQLWLAICFMYYSAIRPGTELRLMKLKQINYDSKTIVIRNYLAKNGRTEIVDIPDQLHHLIVSEWKLQMYDQELFVFSKNGYPGEEPQGKNAMRLRFNKFREELKLSKEIHYYSWKHSGAQELADAGANTYELQRHLRHRELATTECYLKKRIGQRSNMIKHNFPSIG